jgi:type IV pilus assembly protein PilA
MMAAVPPCVVDGFVATEEAVAAAEVDQRRFGVVLRGAGLKAILAPCVKEKELRWVDDHTAVLLSAPATGEPLARDRAIVELLAELDAASVLGFVAGERAMNALSVELPLGTPTPLRMWGELRVTGGPEIRVTAVMFSATDAKDLAARAREMVTRLPAEIQGVTVEQHDARVIGRLPLGALIPALEGNDAPAVAIPAFMKNARKAKTAEATTNVKRMYDGARTHYEELHALAPSTEITPAAGACCGMPGDKCPPDPALWTLPGWQALRFSMDEPHHYSYRYVAEEKGFTVSAYGDLDCDGELSTFEMAGTVQPDGTVAGGAGLYKKHELE